MYGRLLYGKIMYIKGSAIKLWQELKEIQVVC